MNSEHLAYWYFRLNGFFTITNFVMHPDNRGSQRTDADVAGIRFPYRAEFPSGPGGDDPEFLRFVDRPYFVIAEVKKSECRLNGPWTDPGQGNLDDILADLGPFPTDQIPSVAKQLYDNGVSNRGALYCSLFCVGNRISTTVANSYPEVPQRTWTDVVDFIYKRFDEHRLRKLDHQQWDEAGKKLWTIWDHSHDLEGFSKEIRAAFNLPAA